MADSNRKGTFLLSDLRQRSLDGFWETYQTNAQFGWLGAGQVSVGSSISSVDRIDVSNDTVSLRGAMGAGRYGVSATGNANFGWFGGGYTPTVSRVDRVEFANDLATASIRGPLTSARYGYAATGNANYGWYAGGFVSPAPVHKSFVDRITFANDSPASASARGPLSGGKHSLGAASNGFYGWFAGGSIPGGVKVTTVDRIDFANDSPTGASPRGSLVSASYGVSGTGNANYSWFLGRHAAGLPNPHRYQRIDFSNDTIISSTRSAWDARADGNGHYWWSAFGNNNYGWWTGGAPGTNSAPYYSFIVRLDFSNDLVTVASRGNMSVGRAKHGATSGMASYSQYPTQGLGTNEALAGFGWIGHGDTGPIAGTSTVERINFSNDSPTTALARSPLTAAGWASGGVSNANYGWFVGGYGGGSRIDRIDFSNDNNTASTRSFLGASDRRVATASNYNYGWVFGGEFSPTVVQRLDFSNDLARPTIRSNIPLAPGQNSAGTQEGAGAGNADYGWFSGKGSTPTGVVGQTHIFRIEYSNDNVAPVLRGPLSGARYQHAATANNNFGYFIGGYQPSITRVSTVLRVDFANDSPTASSPRGPLPQAINRHSASGNSSFGWTSGGFNPATARISSIYRIDYANDLATASTRGVLTVAKISSSAVSNYVGPSLGQRNLQLSFRGNRIDGTFGWFAGGGPGGGTTVDRVDFSNDSPTTALVRTPLANRRSNLAGVGNQNYGWFGGGYNSPPTVYLSSIQRMTFASDLATLSTGGSLTIGRSGVSALSNANYGWWAGGLNPGFVPTSFIDRLDFSNDAAFTSARGLLISARWGTGATANAYYGWFAGGQTSGGTNTSIVERIDFANDSPTGASLRGFLSTARAPVAAISNQNYGWFVGGVALSTSYDRIDFANDSPTAASVRGFLPLVGRNAGAANSAFGWFSGGYSGGGISRVDRIEFANDTSTTTRGPLSQPRSDLAGASNYVKLPPITNVTQYAISANSVGIGAGTFGWFGGGFAPGVRSTVDRIDFSTDSATASVRGPLSSARYSQAATGNANYGWSAGGVINIAPLTRISSVDRIDFANDSPTSASIRGPLSIARHQAGSTGNANYGWFATGLGPAPSAVSTVDRIDFANDNSTASIRGPLSAALNGSTATGNANFGWFSGGGPSSVNRIDFSNDSPTSSSVRGPLSVTRFFMAAASNANFGWFVGGLPFTSTVERIDFSNDSPTSASVRGLLNVGRSSLAGASNANFGWFSGGQSPVTSVVSRIDFSNDSPTAASPRGPLSSGRYNLAGTSNYTK